MDPSLTEISVPLIGVLLLVRELGAVLRRRKNGNGHDGKNGGKAVMEVRLANVDRRTEEMATALKTLPTAIEDLTTTFRDTARAVDRLIQRMEQREK